MSDEISEKITQALDEMEKRDFRNTPEQVDTRTEEGAQRSAELTAAAEKTRKKRRSEAQLISDGIMDIKRRFDAMAQEMVDGSLEAALDRGEVIRADEVERRIAKAKAAARAELIEYLKQQGEDGK